MKNLAKKVKCFLVVLVLYLTSTFGSLYMLFPYLPLIFVSRKLFHALSDFSLRIWFGLAVFLLEKLCQIKIFFHESKNNLKNTKKFTQSSIIIMNHRTRLDWLFYFCILYRINALSKIKIILKDGLKNIPGPGWAMQSALFIFIKRKWEVDRQILSSFISYYKSMEKKVCILIFPEGTNLTKETISRSDKFAQANNLPPYTQVLYPRVTGFIHIFNEMDKNKQIDCIHDVTVAYRGGDLPENEADFLNGRLPHEIHFYSETFGIENILSDKQRENESEKNKQLESWLNQRWKEKETFLKKFYEDEKENNNNFDAVQSNYETRAQTAFQSNSLFAYALYWTASSLVLIYLINHYLLFKIFIGSAFLFYMSLQLFGKGLDNLIMNGVQADKVDKKTN